MEAIGPLHSGRNKISEYVGGIDEMVTSGNNMRA